MFIEKLNNIFCDIFEIQHSEVLEAEYLLTLKWDSLGHVSLIAALESEFEINIESSDIIKLISYKNVVSYLGKVLNYSDERVEFLNYTFSHPNDFKQVKIHRGLNEVYFDNTKICYIDQELSSLYYRGYLISDLINSGYSFEEILYLLVYGKIPNDLELKILFDSLSSGKKISENQEKIIKYSLHLAPRRVIQAVLSVDSDNYSDIDSQIKLITKVPMIMYYYNTFKTKASFDKSIFSKVKHCEFVLRCLNPTRVYKRDEIFIFEKQMILHMEHGANASSFACRVSASTKANIIDSIISSISTFSGSLHAGAIEKIDMMIDKLMSDISNIESILEMKVKQSKPIYGFGHRVYKSRDPRSIILEQLLDKLIKNKATLPKYIEVALIIKSVLSKYEDKGLGINVDFFSALILRTLNFPIEMYLPSFICARIVGWIAHYEEQVQNNVLIRPRLKYIGEIKKL